MRRRIAITGFYQSLIWLGQQFAGSFASIADGMSGPQQLAEVRCAGKHALLKTIPAQIKDGL
jgi:hypothetical protein